MDSLIGKQAKGFKFSGTPIYVPNGMDKYNGVVGKIVYVGSGVAQIKFPDGGTWNYPNAEILDHLVEEELEEELEEEQSIEEILNNIKNLTKQI